MGFLSEIFGSTKKAAAPTVEGAEAALARLNVERESARAEVRILIEQRRALLLEDGTDDEIAALDQKIAAAELRIERLDEAEPRLLSELAGARDRRRRAQWNELRERGLAAAEKYLASARAAHADLMAYAAIIDEATAAQFTAEARASFPFAPSTLGPDLLAAFDRKLERSTTVIEAKAPTPPKPPAPSAKKAPTPAAAPATPKKAAPPPAPARKLPEPDADGLVSVMTTRNGVPDADGAPLKMGATTRLPLDTAVALLPPNEHDQALYHHDREIRRAAGPDHRRHGLRRDAGPRRRRDGRGRLRRLGLQKQSHRLARS